MYKIFIFAYFCRIFLTNYLLFLTSISMESLEEFAGWYQLLYVDEFECIFVVQISNRLAVLNWQLALDGQKVVVHLLGYIFYSEHITLILLCALASSSFACTCFNFKKLQVDWILISKETAFLLVWSFSTELFWDVKIRKILKGGWR